MGHISENVTLDNPAFIHESAWLYGRSPLAGCIGMAKRSDAGRNV